MNERPAYPIGVDIAILTEKNRRFLVFRSNEKQERCEKNRRNKKEFALVLSFSRNTLIFQITFYNTRGGRSQKST